MTTIIYLLCLVTPSKQFCYRFKCLSWQAWTKANSREYNAYCLYHPFVDIRRCKSPDPTQRTNSARGVGVTAAIDRAYPNKQGGAELSAWASGPLAASRERADPSCTATSEEGGGSISYWLYVTELYACSKTE